MAKEEFNFTKLEIAQMGPNPDGKRRYVYDSKENGLLVQITSTGRKTFQLYKKHKGSPIRVTIGTFPDVTIEQARKNAREIKTALASGENPNDTIRAERQEMTFADLFEDYLTRYAKIEKKTWQTDQYYYDRYLAVGLGRKKFSTISKKDIAATHSKIGRTHQVTANRVFALMSSVFGKAIEWGLWEDENPCQRIKKFSEQSRDRFITKEELPRFFQSLDEDQDGKLRDYILVSLLTGARKANVLSMRWQEVSFEDATWRIPKTKNGDSQTIPLGAEALEILQRRRQDTRSFFVFPGSGKTGHFVEPKKGWRRILDRAGIKNLRLHDLRRTLGSWQTMTGTFFDYRR